MMLSIILIIRTGSVSRVGDGAGAVVGDGVGEGDGFGADRNGGVGIGEGAGSGAGPAKRGPRDIAGRGIQLWCSM